MKSKNQKTKKYFRPEVLILLLVLLFISLYSLKNRTAFTLLIKGTSMSPTYQDQEIVWATYLYSKINHEDVVAIKFNENTIVKRVRFIPGDTFWVMKDDSIHWTPVPNELVADFQNINIWKLKKIIVPKGMFWLEGDNNETSYDSRIHGLFDSKHIVGVLAPWRQNKNKSATTPVIIRMQKLKKQGLPITREKFITNGFKL